MGFFSLKAICALCDRKVGLNRFRIADKKWICPDCFSKAGGLKEIVKSGKPIQKMTVEDIQALIAKKENRN